MCIDNPHLHTEFLDRCGRLFLFLSESILEFLDLLFCIIWIDRLENVHDLLGFRGVGKFDLAAILSDPSARRIRIDPE